ncbi:aspartate-semialdehyde dehydrogenase [Thalassotalea fusca]
MSTNIAIIGATGAVGTEFIKVIAHLKFNYDNLFLVASSRSAGQVVVNELGSFVVQDIAEFDFSQVTYAFFTAGGNVSREWAKSAVDAGAIVIDNTSAFRMDPQVPLIVPEVNQTDYNHERLIANPNCSTIQIVRALAPIEQLFGLSKVVVATYQAASGAGNAGINELHASMLNDGETINDNSNVFSRPLAHNVIPQIDKFLDNDFTFEEEKVRFESRKILGLPSLFITCTAVRVPVFTGHCAAVYVETESEIDINELTSAYESIADVELAEYAQQFPTPKLIESPENVYIGRLRREPDNAKGLWLWVVANNLWVGAALNAVRIAEQLQQADTNAHEVTLAVPVIES